MPPSHCRALLRASQPHAPDPRQTLGTPAADAPWPSCRWGEDPPAARASCSTPGEHWLRAHRRPTMGWRHIGHVLTFHAHPRQKPAWEHGSRVTVPGLSMQMEHSLPPSFRRFPGGGAAELLLLLLLLPPWKLPTCAPGNGAGDGENSGTLGNEERRGVSAGGRPPLRRVAPPEVERSMNRSNSAWSS
mmetsp:Transcript_77388/g.209135  ORF Transcript_77388/g.209135 Transcript_77388/m.209135 type:complete len:188 (+) Transcript_77388:394-957(+)